MRQPFRVFVEAEVFEKAGAPAGQRRRIGGIVSTEQPDQEGEVVLQRGLDFKPFLKSGWFNDNHSQATADGVLGYPAEVKMVRKGEMLPSGRKAEANAHWVEGYLLPGWKPAQKIWELGKSLQDTGRRLGFSIEGKIQQRTGPKNVFKKSKDGGKGEWVGNTIAKAVVRNVAITNCPVNQDTGLEVLAKSLMDADRLSKMVTAGVASPTGEIPSGVRTGDGAARVLAPRSLEWAGDPRFARKRKKRVRKSLTTREACRWVTDRRPTMSKAQVERFVNLCRVLKTQGRGVVEK